MLAFLASSNGIALFGSVKPTAKDRDIVAVILGLFASSATGLRQENVRQHLTVTVSTVRNCIVLLYRTEIHSANPPQAEMNVLACAGSATIGDPPSRLSSGG
jgi:hypothetical protein